MFKIAISVIFQEGGLFNRHMLIFVNLRQNTLGILNDYRKGKKSTVTVFRSMFYIVKEGIGTFRKS